MGPRELTHPISVLCMDSNLFLVIYICAECGAYADELWFRHRIKKKPQSLLINSLCIPKASS